MEKQTKQGRPAAPDKRRFIGATIPGSLIDALKGIAARRGLTLSRLAGDWIEDRLKKEIKKEQSL